VTRSGAGLSGRLRRMPSARAAIAWAGAVTIRLLSRMTRWQVEGAAHREGLLAGGQGFVTAFWHGRLLMSGTWPAPGRVRVAMISNNRDGALIAAVVARLGAEAVRGSTRDRVKNRDKGGQAAFRAAREALERRAAVVGITPDGPRGPRMRAQPGVAQLSIATGCAVLPVGWSVRRGWLVRSWDRFLVPWPLTRGALVHGAPLWPPADSANDPAVVETYRARIEAALNAVTERADRLCGRVPVSPAPVEPDLATSHTPGAA
jgi:hypothetical protein